MPTRTPLLSRRPVVASAALAVAAGLAFGYVAHGQDRVRVTREAKAADLSLSPAEQRMVLEHMAQAKKNAGEPKEAERITGELAELIAMDEVARAIAADPGVRQQHEAEMTDSALRKVHDDAMRLATDPKRLERKKKEILADPSLLKTVLHQAEIMQMMRDAGPAGGQTLHVGN